MSQGLSRKAAHVQRILAELGLHAEVRELEAATRTAQDAAAAVGCALGQIVKTLLFRTRGGSEPVLVLARGTTWVDTRKLRSFAGGRIGKAGCGLCAHPHGLSARERNGIPERWVKKRHRRRNREEFEPKTDPAA